MGSSAKYWYDGEPFRGQTSDNGEGRYWYDGVAFADVTTSDLTISSTSGIPSAEAFGADGNVANIQTLAGNGIASEEAFGVGYIQPGIWGANGILSAEAFGAAATDSGIVTGDIFRFTGIPSAEAFGANGNIQIDQTVSGAAGIASGEAFGAVGLVTNAGVIAGLTGIPSGEAFGTNAVVAGPIVGTSGITSSVAFGADGSLGIVIRGVSTVPTPDGNSGIMSGEKFGSGGSVGGIAGSNGITSEEAFGTGTVTYDQTIAGAAGISSGEAFGAGGFLDGPQTITGTVGISSSETFGSGTLGSIGNITGSSGITSEEAFGSGTVTLPAAAQTITGATGIPSAEAFGSGSLTNGIQGSLLGIPSEEAFGDSGLVLNLALSDPTVLIYWNSERANDYLKINTLNIRTPSRGRGECGFTWYTTEDVRPSLGDRIEVYYRVQPLSVTAPELIFAGTIESLSEKKLVKYQASTDVEIQVRCTDWNQILDRRLFTYAVPAGSTCLSILREMKRQILDDENIGLSSGDPGLVVPEKTYDRVECSQVINELCEASGWDARVGYDRILYFGPNPLLVSESIAPYSITDTSEEFTEIAVQTSRSSNRYRNTQHTSLSGSDRVNKARDVFVVVSGKYSYYTTTGIPGTPSVLINGNPAILNSNGVSVTGWQIRWDQDSNVIRLNTDNLPANGSTIEVEYPSDAANWNTLTNAPEVAARAAAEGGSGLYERRNNWGGENGDTSTMSENVLSRYSEFGAQTAQVESNHWGWKAGQDVVMNITRPYIQAGTYYIEEVSHTFEHRNFSDPLWTSDFRTGLRIVKNGRIGQGFREKLGSGGGGGGGFGGGGGGGFHPGGGGWSPGDTTINTSMGTTTNNGGAPTRYLFLLAASQPGCANAGMVEGYETLPQVVCFPGIIREVQAYVAVQNGDQNVIMDVTLNGASLFSAVGKQPQFPPTGASPNYTVRTFDSFRSRNVPVRRGDLLRVKVQQTGSSDPGASGAEHGHDAQIVVVVI